MSSLQFLRSTGFGDHPVVPISATELSAVTIGFGILAVVSLGFCISVAVQKRTMWPIYLYIGAGFALWYETLTDLLGRCVWAPAGDWPASVDLFGRELPLFALFVYFVYFPIVQTIIISALERGLEFRTWVKYELAVISGAILFELVPVARKWWWYFGDGQPLSLNGYPIYWAFAAEATVCCGAATIYLLRRNGFLTDRFSWLIIAIPAITTPMIHMAVVWPAHTAVSNSTNLWVTTPAALVTIFLACTMFTIFGLVATRQSQADKREREAAAELSHQNTSEGELAQA